MGNKSGLVCDGLNAQQSDLIVVRGCGALWCFVVVLSQLVASRKLVANCVSQFDVCASKRASYLACGTDTVADTYRYVPGGERRTLTKIFVQFPISI